MERINVSSCRSEGQVMPETTRRPLTIAIDGPAAAGKSSVARAVAERLGLAYVDTGAMYRALTLKALDSGVDPEDDAALARLAAGSVILFKPARTPGLPQEVWLDGCDITRDVRSRPVDQAVSVVSKHPAVRLVFRDLQRSMAQEHGAVMEGRDIGTVVLPRADVKVFLDARFARRVKRRFEELEKKGYQPRLADVREDMARRDRIDSSREAAPLTAAADAIRIDTTRKSLDQVIDEVTQLCLEHRGKVL